MTRYNSNFREPPWVMGSPKEVMYWMEASHPSKKEDEKSDTEKQYLKNLHIKFDFNVNHREIQSNDFFSKITGSKKIEEDFELFETSELILRGLAKAKFRNLAKIIVDGEKVYDHPEIKSDLRKTIDDYTGFSEQIKPGKNIEITAILSDIEKATATIKVNKIHKKKEHSVDIQIKGKIRKDVYHTFTNYLNEKIGLQEEES